MTKSLTVLQTGLTYDKVLRDIDRREIRTGSVEANWNNYIDIARGLLAVAEVSRMAVAEVATRATILRCGGDRHSLNFKDVQSKLTVKAFSNSIGVKPATLWLWIKIKTRVFDTLTEKQRRKFKHDAGEKAYKLLGNKSSLNAEMARRVYKRISTRTKEQRAADKSVRHVLCLRKVFRQYREHLTPKEIQAIRIALLEILKIIEETS